MKSQAILVGLFFAVAATGAYAETWTGCVNPGGQIKAVQQGDVPLRSCQPNERIIHLSDLASKQNTAATYDHELMCNALSSAGASSATLDALGCPSGGEDAPFGDVMRSLPEDLGPLTIAPCANASEGYCFNIPSAFVGRQFQVPNLGPIDNLEDDGECPTACRDDDRCFLAWLENASEIEQPSLACHLYYRSDLLPAVEQYCSQSAIDAETECKITLRNLQPHWYRQEGTP